MPHSWPRAVSSVPYQPPTVTLSQIRTHSTASLNREMHHDAKSVVEFYQDRVRGFVKVKTRPDRLSCSVRNRFLHFD